jgi:ATP-dependent DNA helicase RecQ
MRAMSSSVTERANRLLQDAFGLETLRPFQVAAIEAWTEGRDVLVVQPTGGGKSLCYQLPALLGSGTSIVVSPLIALMTDQVARLRARDLPAACLNSLQTPQERQRTLERARRGDLKLLYVTPERFRSPAFLAALPEMRVERLAVDEAHCISEWGHDFRPDYWRLGAIRELLGRPPTMALTATATPKVAADILGALDLSDPLRLQAGIERPNLFFGFREVEDPEAKLARILETILAVDGPGIVYSTLIRDLEHLHTELKRRGVDSLVYHGKLSSEERRRYQDRFMSSERQVVLATNAFGLGVDKPDIRFVLHAQVPRTLEAWTQEVGRAGRDGRPSWCELLLHPEDLAVQQNFIGWANPDPEFFFGVYETLVRWGERLQAKELEDLTNELLVKNRRDNRAAICLKWLEVLGVVEGSFETHDLRLVRDLDPDELPEFVGSEEKARRDLSALLGLWRFAQGDGRCRRALLHEHFGEPAPETPCGTCDVCVDAESWRHEHMPQRPQFAPRMDEPRPAKIPTAPPGPEVSEPVDAPPFERGDWVRVGHHFGQVVRVDRRGNRWELLVESASDFKRRKVDPRRQRVERLEGGG